MHPQGEGAHPATPELSRFAERFGKVEEEAAGTRRIYHLNEVALVALRDQLDTFWNRALSGYQHVIDETNTETP